MRCGRFDVSTGRCDVTNDDDAMSQMRLHQECWELLPWVVNGRLSSADAARVGEHLRGCSRCSEELHAQQQLYEALRHEDPVLLAPQASLKKMWQRFETSASLHEQPTARAHSQSAHAQPGWSGDAAANGHGSEDNHPDTSPAHAAARRTSSTRYLRFAVAAQALLILGLLGMLSWQTFERWQDPRFMTLTTPALTSGPAGSVRVVFVSSAAMRDVNQLLRSLRAEILAGPNTAGVFTLGLPDGVNADAVALQLRNHPNVQFAESIPTVPVQP
jgi:hypothetical protein